MKIRNIINSTIALFMVLTFASCDALDLKPISFITNESFWQTEDDVKGALNGTKSKIEKRSRRNYGFFFLR